MAKVVPRLIFWDDRTCLAQMTPANNGVRSHHIRFLPVILRKSFLFFPQCFHIHVWSCEQFGMEERITQPCSRLVVNTAAMTRKTSFQPSVPKPPEISGGTSLRLLVNHFIWWHFVFLFKSSASWFIDQLLFFVQEPATKLILFSTLYLHFFSIFFITCAFLFHPMGELIATLAHLLPRGALSAGGRHVQVTTLESMFEET